MIPKIIGITVKIPVITQPNHANRIGKIKKSTKPTGIPTIEIIDNIIII
jgi:hypothetical protein